MPVCRGGKHREDHIPPRVINTPICMGKRELGEALFLHLVLQLENLPRLKKPVKYWIIQSTKLCLDTKKSKVNYGKSH